MPGLDAVVGGEELLRLGVGGMKTKLQAADLATAQGIDTYVCNGRDPSVLYDILEGKSAGTRFKGRS